jgi:hypothetical protein
MLAAYSNGNDEYNSHRNPRISLVDGDNAITAECKLSGRTLSRRHLVRNERIRTKREMMLMMTIPTSQLRFPFDALASA